MESLAERTKRVLDKSASMDAREKGVVDRHTSTVPSEGLANRTAKAMAQMEIEARRSQRAYAEQQPSPIAKSTYDPTKYMLENLGDRHTVLETLRIMTPEQRDEALRLAPGIAQQLGDDRGGGVARTLGALSRGGSHLVAQPAMELFGIGGTPEEIEYIRKLDAAASQEFNPAIPSDPWYERGPLQAVEMAQWMATIVGGGGLGRAGATAIAKTTAGKATGRIFGRVAAQGGAKAAVAEGATGLSAGSKLFPGLTAGRIGELAGITSATFPGQYAQEVDQLKAIGMQDGPKLRLLAGGTALVVGLIEGLVPNPLKAGPVPLNKGAATAARQYLWEAAKRAPAEMSEEYLQGVTSGLGQHVAQYIDENSQDKTIKDAFELGWQQTKEAALPMAFLLGAPAVGGAGLNALQAQRLTRLQEMRAKGFISEADANEAGIEGKSRKERKANIDAEIGQLEALSRRAGQAVGKLLGTRQQSQNASQVPMVERQAQNEGQLPTVGSPSQDQLPTVGSRQTPFQEQQIAKQQQRFKEKIADQRERDLWSDPMTPFRFAMAEPDVAKDLAGRKTMMPKDFEETAGVSTPYPDLRRQWKNWVKEAVSLDPEVAQALQQEPADTLGPTWTRIPNGVEPPKHSSVEVKKTSFGTVVRLKPSSKGATNASQVPTNETRNDVQGNVGEGSQIPGSSQVRVEGQDQSGTQQTGQKPTAPQVPVEKQANQPTAPTTGTATQAGQVPPLPAAKPEIRRGEVGGMLSAGEVVTTSSGRKTTPFPSNLSTDSERKAQNTVKRVDEWLWQNAVDEARSRNDDYNLTIFSNEDPKRLPPASKDAMEEYLFGEQPKVVPPITKPLIRDSGTVTPKPASPAAESEVARVPSQAASVDPDVETALGKFKTRLGVEVTATPSEKLTAEQQEVLDFATSRGQKMAFVGVAKSDKKVPIGSFYREENVVLIREDLQGDKLWGTIGHEMAHSKGLDNILPADSAELKTMMDEYYQLASPEVQKRLMVNKRDHQREGRARMVQKFFEDKEFRDELKKTNPTMWDKLREAVLKFIGQWTPKDEAKRLLLEELRAAPKPEKSKGLKPQESLSQDKKSSVPDVSRTVKRTRERAAAAAEEGITPYVTVLRSLPGGRRQYEGYNPTTGERIATGNSIAGPGSVPYKLSNRKGRYQPVDTALYSIGENDTFTPQWYESEAARYDKETDERIAKAEKTEEESSGISKNPTARSGKSSELDSKPGSQPEGVESAAPKTGADIPATKAELGMLLRDRVVAKVQELYDTKNYSEDGLLATVKRSVDSEFGKLTTEVASRGNLTDDVREWINEFDANKFTGSVRAYLGRKEAGTEREPSGNRTGTEREPSGNRTGTTNRPDLSISGQSKPIPGMEAEEATYVVHKRKPDMIPDTFSVVVAGKPKGKGWSTFKGTGMNPEEAYDRAVRMFTDERAAKPTKPSADQVNVDSGEESKVKPDFKQNDKVEVTYYGRVLKGRVYSVQGSEPGTVLVELDNRVGDPQEYLVEQVKVVSGGESKGKQTAEKPKVSPIGDKTEAVKQEPWQMTFDEYRESRLKYADENGMTREEYQESYTDDVLRADYNRNVQDPPRNADIRLEVYDQLPTSIQQRWRKFLFDLDDRLNKRDSENFEKDNKPYADAQKYIEQKLADYEKMRKEKSSQEFTAQESKDVSTLEFLRGKLISVRATKEDKDAVISQLKRRKDFGTSERKQVASPLPWRDSSPDDESKWYGTKINVAPANRREDAYTGKVVRVLNRGEMVEVQPDGQDGTFRVDSSRITLAEEQAPTTEKQPEEQASKPLPEPETPKFTRTTPDKGSTTRTFQSERVDKARADIAELEKKARAKRSEHDSLRSNATKKRAAVRKEIESFNRMIQKTQGEIASDMAADTLAKLEDELESPRSYDHYLAGMKAIHKLKASVAEDAARRGEMGRQAAITVVEKEQKEADRLDAELQSRAKEIAMSKGFTSGDADQIALSASNGFTIFEDRSLADVVEVQGKRTRESRVSREINKLKPESSYGRQQDLSNEQIAEFTKQYQEASLDDKNWLAKRLVVDTAVKDAIEESRAAVRKREDEERKVKEAEKAKEQQEALANARERAKKYFLDERISKALKKQKPKTKPVKVRQESAGGPVKVVDGKTIDGDQNGELYPNGLILHKSFGEDGNDFALTHARSGLAFPFIAKKSSMQELIGLLDILGVDFNIDTDEKGALPSELVARVTKINTAWDNGDYSTLSEQDYATVEALGQVAKTDIDADLILTADDLGANGIPPGLESVFTDRGLRVVKGMAAEVPEFAYDPVFTVKDGMLLYRDGYEFNIDPTAFNLHPSELKEGQTVGINLEDFGIKRATPQDVVAQVMKVAGIPRVTKGKGGDVSVGYVGSIPASLQQSGEDNEWVVVSGTPKVREMAIAALKKIRWRQPGQDGDPKTDIDVVPADQPQAADDASQNVPAIQSEEVPTIDPFSERSPESAERRKLIAEAKNEMRPYYQIEPEIGVEEGIRNAINSFVAGTSDNARIIGGADGKALGYDGSTKQWNAIIKRAQSIADKTNAVQAVVAVGDTETGVPTHAVIISSPGFVGATFESQNTKPFAWGNTIEKLYDGLPSQIVMPEVAKQSIDSSAQAEAKYGNTPLGKLFAEAKAAGGDTMLFFRMGDFYELYFEDAQKAAKMLGLTLTTRDKSVDNPIPMTGFPYHQLDGYLKKLKSAGIRIAVNEAPFAKPQAKAKAEQKTEPESASVPTQAEFMEMSVGVNAPGVKQTIRVTAGERTLLMERSKHDGEWSIKEAEKYTGEVKGKTPVKTKGAVLASGIIETKKAKEIAQRIIDGTFDKDSDKRFVREDTQNIGLTNAGIAESMKGSLGGKRDSFAKLLREQGLVTDGRILMKVNDKDRDAILKGVGETDEGRSLDAVSKMMTDGQKALSRSANAMKPIGYRGGYLTPRTVVLQSQDGDAAIIDKSLHDTILKKYPNAVPYFLEDGKPISYVIDGDLVAIVMPMNMDKPDAKVKDLVAGKYDFEAEAAEAEIYQWDRNVNPRPPKKKATKRTSKNDGGESRMLDEFTSPELQNRQSMGAAKVQISSASDLVGDDHGSTDSKYASPDSEFERRWKLATRGVGKTTLAEKLREFWKNLVKSTVRGSLPELPRSKEFGEARSALHAYQNAATYAQLAAADLLKKTSKPLSASDYDLFTRVVIMRDQKEASDRGERLSYGLTPEKVESELKRLESLVAKNERVQASLEYRKQWTEAMVGDFLSAHEYLGMDMSDRFSRENYFRHQVLYYMQAQQRGLGKKKVELTPNRGWLKGRTSGEDLGEMFDINANYLQAEWEVSTQMIADTKRAQAIGRLKRHYDKMQQLKTKAKHNNYVAVVGGQDVMDEIEELRGLMAELRAQGSLDSGEKAQMKEWSERLWELDPTMPFRRDMAIAAEAIEKGAENLGEEVQADFVRYVSSLAEREGHPLQTMALKFLKAMSGRKAFIKNALGNDYQTWEDVVPDDHEEVAIRPGRAMFQAYSVPEQIASELMADLSKTLGINADTLRPLTALGSKYTPLVVPKEVAAQMMSVDNKMDFGWLDHVVTKPMNAWKRWILMGPTRFIKYNLRNLSEVDKVMALNPAALKDVPRAVMDLWKLYSGADDIPASVRDWVERGGTNTLVQVNELGDLNNLKEFARLISDKNSGIAGKLIKAPVDAWRTYWSKIGMASNFRESILRYAAYLNYLRQLESGKLTNYGGSVRAEVDGIKDNKDKAMRLSADLLGDYSDISLLGQFMRSRIAPFWSFQETNVRTYFRGLINLASNEQSAIKAGMQIAKAVGIGGLAKTPFLAYKLGRIAILFYGLSAMATVFNQLWAPDDDDELPEEEKKKAHLTFGKNSKGEVQYFSRIGTAADVLDWVGLDSVDYDLRDVLDGRRTLNEVVKDMAISPLDKAYGMLSPFMKVPTELAVGQTAYPHVGKPRPIRDRGQYLAKNLGIEKEYNKLVGNPSTPYSATDVILYKVEPGTSAYYMTQDAKSRWLKTVRNRGVGYSESVRGDAMRSYKMALRLNDKVAADKYLAQYQAAGGTKEGMLDSLESSHPSGGLSTVDSILFYNSLSPVEQDEYKKAERFYYSELLTEDQAKEIRSRREKRLRDMATGKNKDGSPKGKPEKKRDETAEKFRERLHAWQEERKIAKEALQDLD